MRRIPDKAATYSTQGGKKRILRDAFREIDELRDQIEKLENAQPRKAYGVADALWEPPIIRRTLTPKARRGPEPKHGEWTYRKRDDIASVLDNYWPRIESTCYPELDIAALRNVLKSLTKLPRGSNHASLEHLMDNFPVLIAFLKTDRFRGDPHQIANAMAGVPGISFWRSLKVCQKVKCDIGPGLPAIKAYVRRKHPRLYANLELNPTDLLHFMRCMREYNTREKNMWVYRQNPMLLLEAWKAAEK